MKLRSTIGGIVLGVCALTAVTLRASDIKCRWGGDEFLVVLPETALPGAVNACGALTREVGQQS